MKILIATPEAVPYVKTGGLADVTGALLKEFRRMKKDASLILPLYSVIKNKFEIYKTDRSFKITLGGISLNGNIWVSEKSSAPESYFIDCKDLYGRSELYGTSNGDYSDNALRFAFFSRAVIETCIAMNLKPDIIHCNDWQTAMTALYLKTVYKDNKFFRDTSVLFTIHNLGYQGLFPASDIKFTGIDWDYFIPERLEFYGKLNFMKAGLLYSDLISTVSKTYAKEILEPESGFGLDGVLRKRKNNIYGIINGTNYNEWNPAKDSLIPANYSSDDLRGKESCKKLLLKKTGLQNSKLPLFGIVSRLTSQKGIDLIEGSLDKLLAAGANLVILGKGEDYYQKLLTNIAKKHRKRIFVKIGFDESLAHLIYAGCDFLLMPSKYEPCGLGQMVAMKYGTIPIARETGGLADTIHDFDHLLSKGTGFLFTDYTPSAFIEAVKRAICVFTDNKKMRKMISDSMKSDFSWKSSAEKYLRLYRKISKKAKA